ncbi:hypothetical protein [Microtetraspora malaysiensis]|uniref:hypothetical protein n=1 Tax=Microtetraspora malaysiensis TaxID=161358 RepID=UPI003D937551
MTRISRRLAVTLALVASAATMAACSGTSASGEGQTITYHADYPAYDSANNLFQKADVVIEATMSAAPARVQELKPDTTSDDPKLNPAAGAPAEQAAAADPVVISVYRAEVKKVYKGAVQPGQTIEIQQLGGQLDGITYQEAEAYPLKQETGYVLFLQTYPDAPAALLNPVQGQYPLDAAGKPSKLPENLVALTADDLKRISGAN